MYFLFIFLRFLAIYFISTAILACYNHEVEFNVYNHLNENILIVPLTTNDYQDGKAIKVEPTHDGYQSVCLGRGIERIQVFTNIDVETQKIYKQVNTCSGQIVTTTFSGVSFNSDAIVLELTVPDNTRLAELHIRTLIDYTFKVLSYRGGPESSSFANALEVYLWQKWHEEQLSSQTS